MSTNRTKWHWYNSDVKKLKSYYYWNVKVKKYLEDKPGLTFDWKNDSKETLRNKLISLYKYNIKIGKAAWDIVDY